MTASVRTVSCTVAASLGLHGLLLLLAAWLITVLPVWERNRTSVAALPALTAAMSSGETEPELQEVAVSFLSLEPGPEKPVPPPPPVTSSAPPPSGTMTVRPREDQPALAPFNQNTPFISSQNMRAAATTAPTPGAAPNHFNQDGHKISGLSLTTTDFIPGSEAQPPADSRPPEPTPSPPDSPDPVIAAKSQPPPPPKNERPPEPSATVKTEDPLAPAPAPTPAPRAAEALAMRADPMGPTGRFMLNGGGFNANSREGHAAEIGSANGVTNARGLAGLYAPLANGGSLNGVRLVGADTLTRMSRVSVATHQDATLCIPTRFSLGYMKSMDNRALENAEDCSAILSEAAFGHVGAGGSIGFADPERRMSFGYAMNRMGAGILLNDRGQGLVDAAYRALGCRSLAALPKAGYVTQPGFPARDRSFANRLASRPLPWRCL